MSELYKTYAALVLEPGGVWHGESPLHVTLGQPTAMSATRLAEFITLLRVDLHDFGPVSVTGTEEDWFGPTCEDRVRRVAHTAELLYLHELILDAQRELDADLVVMYPDFNPHATSKTHLALREHQRLESREVGILQKPDDTTWRKVATIPLCEE